MPSARGGGTPELLRAIPAPARGVLPCTDEDVWPFSRVSLFLLAALASAIAACTCNTA